MGSRTWIRPCEASQRLAVRIFWSWRWFPLRRCQAADRLQTLSGRISQSRRRRRPLQKDRQRAPNCRSPPGCRDRCHRRFRLWCPEEREVGRDELPSHRGIPRRCFGYRPEGDPKNEILGLTTVHIFLFISTQHFQLSHSLLIQKPIFNLKCAESVIKGSMNSNFFTSLT